MPADRAEAHADTDSEYDFMGSKEGVSAKLDLGRAYIEMEDYHAARKVLQEVIQHGEAEQQMEAQGLIDEMPPEDE